MALRTQIQMVLILMLLFMAVYPLLVAVFSYSDHSRFFRSVHFLVWTGTCGILAFLAFEKLSQNLKAQAALFGVLALMFFPFSPVHFPHIFWFSLNIAAIGIVAFSIAGDRGEAPEGTSQSISVLITLIKLQEITRDTPQLLAEITRDTPQLFSALNYKGHSSALGGGGTRFPSWEASTSACESSEARWWSSDRSLKELRASSSAKRPDLQ